MTSEESTTVSAALLAALAGPAEVTTDGVTVRQQNLADLIAADRYFAAKAAASSPARGLRFTRLAPPGTARTVRFDGRGWGGGGGWGRW